MRKFECNTCKSYCELTIQRDEFIPEYCMYDTMCVDWHEVKEENTQQFGNSEQLPSNPRKLPDWVKVGKWIYNTKRPEYFKILSLNQLAWISDEIKNGDYIEARKRPFNADEMRALVGKIIQKDNDIGVVMHYFGKDNEVLFCNSFATSEDLMNNNCVIYSTGKPCFKLEHLNENGEWVE